MSMREVPRKALESLAWSRSITAHPISSIPLSLRALALGVAQSGRGYVIGCFLKDSDGGRAGRDPPGPFLSRGRGARGASGLEPATRQA